MARRELLDPVEHGGERRARNRAVDAIVVGRDASHGRERGLAPGPEAQALRLVARAADVGRAARAHHLDHPRGLVGDFLVRAVGFGQQDRLGFQVVAGVHDLLHGARGELVHHLEARGHDARADHARDRFARALDRRERRHDHLGGLRFRQELHGHFQDHGEEPLGPRHQREEVVARRIERLRPDLEHVALARDRAHARDVVDREAVLEAMHAAGILGDVAADGAGDLARRVGRVIEAVRPGLLRDAQVRDAGLHARLAAEEVDGEDAVELRERHQDAVGERQRAARKAGSRAACNDGCVRRARHAKDLRDLALVRGDHRGERRLAVSREPVAFVGLELFALEEHGAARQGLREAAGHLCDAGRCHDITASCLLAFSRRSTSVLRKRSSNRRRQEREAARRSSARILSTITSEVVVTVAERRCSSFFCDR